MANTAPFPPPTREDPPRTTTPMWPDLTTLPRPDAHFSESSSRLYYVLCSSRLTIARAIWPLALLRSNYPLCLVPPVPPPAPPCSSSTPSGPVGCVHLGDDDHFHAVSCSGRLNKLRSMTGESTTAPYVVAASACDVPFRTMPCCGSLMFPCRILPDSASARVL